MSAALWNMYCKPGKSPIHGVGMFAIRDISKGTVIMPAKNLTGTWKTIEWAKDNRVPSGVVSMMQQYVSSEVYGDDYIFVPRDPIVDFPAQMLMNHSSSPNVQINYRNEIQAIKDIQEGEELTENYLR